MTLKIISAEDILFEGEVSAVHLPGANGEFTVLRNHAAIISTLTPGEVRYDAPNGGGEIDVAGGMVDVQDNVVSVCIY